ncbi:MAG TPA: TMEM175 family protein [Thermoplasmata archaeon]|nr:TMEM175 family protein [Thermoplasmata archaeon]
MFEDRLSYEGREKRAHTSAGREPPGEDIGRIISLADGVFAFSLTLLVLGLTVPIFDTTGLSSGQVSGHLANLLQGDWQKFASYVFAFAMISIWWMVHHRTFRYIERYDFVLMWLNMIVLLEVAVMPFVLQLFAQYSGTQVAVALFAFMQMATGLTINALWRYAARGHRLIDPKLSTEEIRYFANRGLWPALAFGGSILVTFVNVSWAEYLWVLPIVLNRFSTRYGVD